MDPARRAHAMAADPLKDLKRPPYSTLSSPGGHSERQIRQLAHLFEAAVRHEEEGDHAVGVRHGLSRAVLFANPPTFPILNHPRGSRP